jgi:hypothetical protein
MAGLIVLLSLALSQLHDQAWLWLTAFAGLNLLQSALTNWCPAVWLLQKAGLPKCTAQPRAGET